MSEEYKSDGEVRECVMAFAWAMEMKMRQREYKGPWKNFDLDSRMMLLTDEFEELCAETNNGYDEDTGQGSNERVAAEAVDVAVTSMIVWDLVEPGERDDGR